MKYRIALNGVELEVNLVLAKESEIVGDAAEATPCQQQNASGVLKSPGMNKLIREKEGNMHQ